MGYKTLVQVLGILFILQCSFAAPKPFFFFGSRQIHQTPIASRPPNHGLIPVPGTGHIQQGQPHRPSHVHVPGQVHAPIHVHPPVHAQRPGIHQPTILRPSIHPPGILNRPAIILPPQRIPPSGGIHGPF